MRRRSLWLATALTAIAAGTFWEMTTLVGLPVARDMQMFFVPMRALLAEALRAGEIPLWSPLIGTGAPLLANLQSGVFYPPHWLFAVLPFDAAFNWLIIFHLATGGCGALALLNQRTRIRRSRRGLSPVQAPPENAATSAAAFSGAAVWMLGGYMASLLNLLGALQASAWTPWVVWAAVEAWHRPSTNKCAALVATSTMCVLAGEIQIAVLTGTLAAAVILFLERRAVRARGAGFGWRSVACLALAGVWTLGLCAVQLLPTAELVANSSRQGGLAPGEVMAFSLEPVRLVHLAVPPSFRDPEFSFGVRAMIGQTEPWLFSLYLGGAFPLWLVLGLGSAGSTRRREYLFWTGIGFVGLVLAAGRHGPVFPFLLQAVPWLGMFRFPEKYFLLTALAASAVTTIATEAALGRPRRGGFPWLVCWPVVLVAAALGLEGSAAWVAKLADHWGNPRMADDPQYVLRAWQGALAAAAAVAGLAGTVVHFARRGLVSPRKAGVLICLITVADLAASHRGLAPVAPLEFFTKAPAVLGPARLDQTRVDYRWRSSPFDDRRRAIGATPGLPVHFQKLAWRETAAPNTGLLHGIQQQDAWDALRLSRAEDARQLLRILDWRRRWRLLRLHSVRYLLARPAIPTLAAADSVSLVRGLPGVVYELRAPLPRAYVVPRAVIATDEVEAVDLLLSPDFDPAAAVVLAARPRHRPRPRSKTDVESAREDGFPGARIVENHPGRVRIVTSGQPGWVVLTDSSYPGWKARVDGAVRPIHTANRFFRAVQVEAGETDVVFRYQPASFTAGLWVSLSFLAAGIAFLIRP